MPDQHPAWETGEDIQTLDNALADTELPRNTRRFLIERAATTLLTAGGAGVLLAACGSSSTPGGSSSSPNGSGASTSASPAPAGGSGAEIQKIIDTAITAEALAVTYLSAVIKNAGGTPVAKFTEVLKAANAAEYDHYKTLKSLGAKPLTTKFWAPHAFFGPKLSGVFPTLEVAETLFVNAYLIAMTNFAKAGKTSLVRYSSEIAGVEAQHLALARFAAGKLPNDVGFADYSITSIDGIVAALEKTGVGFGKQGSAPGSFASFSPPSADVLTSVTHTTPQ